MWRLPYVIVRNIFRIPQIIGTMRRKIDDTEGYSEEDCYQYMQYIVSLMHRTGHIHTEVYGVENLPKEGGYMLYPNHQGKYDAYGIVGGHPTPCTVVMDEAKSHVIFIREIMDMLRGKRLEIRNARQGLTIINEITREVSDGRRYILFPQGGYDEDQKNTVGDFKPGCFRISLKSRTPIVPVVIRDSYKVFNSWQLAPVTTQVHFLEAIPYEDFQDMRTNQIAAMVRGRILDKLEELENS